MAWQLELHREKGSRLGRVVYRDDETEETDKGQEQTWPKVLAEARKLEGAGSTVRVRVFGQSQWYGTGHRQLTTYWVQLPRQHRDGS